MSLPKTTHKIFTIVIPSTGKKAKFRQFVTKEEKILLTAKQTGDSTEIVSAVEQIITNCALDKTFSVDSLTTFDFDYIFLRLRAVSVSNSTTVKYTDPDTDEEISLTVDLDKVSVPKSTANNKIINGDGITIELRYPTMKEMTDIIDVTRENTEQGIAVDMLDMMLVKCVSKVYSDEEVFDDFSDDQLIEWIGEQTHDTLEAIRTFIAAIPDLTHTIQYETKEGEKRELVLKGIDDFFTW